MLGVRELILPAASNSWVTSLFSWWRWSETAVQQFCTFVRDWIHLQQLFSSKHQIPRHCQRPLTHRSGKKKSKRAKEEGWKTQSCTPAVDSYSSQGQTAKKHGLSIKQSSMSSAPLPVQMVVKTGARDEMATGFVNRAKEHRHPADIKTTVLFDLFLSSFVFLEGAKFSFWWLELVWGLIEFPVVWRTVCQKLLMFMKLQQYTLLHRHRHIDFIIKLAVSPCL